MVVAQDLLILVKLGTLIFGALGLLAAYKLYIDTERRPAGNERMVEIASAIRTGALAFLRAEFRALAPLVVVVAAVLSYFLDPITGACFISGAVVSLLAGLVGMKAATMANVRTAQAASEGKADQALLVAFNGGAVMGLAVACLVTVGLGVLLYLFGTPETFQPMIGFGMGASSVALFARVGGGIYTKAADVGADLVGKVEANIPEDDPRNPGVIADNVGDNVGDVAGMGADIFESFVTSVIGCIALGATATEPHVALVTGHTGLTPEQLVGLKTWLMGFPVAIALLGLVGSFVAIKSMSFLKGGDPAKALRNTSFIAAIVFLALAAVFVPCTPLKFTMWVCLLVGTVAGIGIGLLTEYYTGSTPVFKIIEGARTGPATAIIAGLAVGLNSCVVPILLIVGAVLSSNYLGGFYGVALAAVGMLATTGITMTIDAYGPIADNAGGISEMSELGKESRAITDKLDALGNTTAAIGKGFAIGSAGLAALSVFGAYVEALNAKSGAHYDFTIINSKLIAGAFIGALLPAVVSSLTMSAVGRAAGLMVTEIRRQFREIAGLLEGKPGVKPDVSKCVEISTKAAISEMIKPGVIAAVTPILVGFLIGPEALGGLLLGTTIVGVLFGMFMSNTGGAWDNAKKFIEQGLVPGEKKGTDTHKAAVVGDTVGDPFKDTSGPSLNILIKMVSMLALLIAPLL
jgi:K(+)-stimulated pyrophosphate-energized sodium pump